jgi:hypothetical protein
MPNGRDDTRDWIGLDWIGMSIGAILNVHRTEVHMNINVAFALLAAGAFT